MSKHQILIYIQNGRTVEIRKRNFERFKLIRLIRKLN